MSLDRKIITGLESQQIAYPVGLEKDAYNVYTWFKHNIETLETIVTCELVKNPFNNEKNPSKSYKEGTKFKETLHKGSYKECIEYFKDNILNTQKEWIRNEKMDYVYPD